ncbi:MAG: hypothetical protein AB1630_01980 [bacterium]
MKHLGFFVLLALPCFGFELSLEKGFIIEGTNNVSSSLPCYFNPDTNPDIAMGVPDDNRVYIFSENHKGTISIDLANYKVFGREGEKIGFSLALGDINGKENKDLIIGCPEAGTCGKVYIIECPIDRHEVHLELNEGIELLGEIENEKFGYSIATGRINGDWFDDIVISAKDSKTIYLFLGDYVSPIKTLSLPGKESIIGDINKDGFGDIATILDGGLIIYWGSSTYPYIAGSSFFAGSYSCLSGGDINNDGFYDLVIGGDKTYIFYGTNTDFGSLTETIDYSGNSIGIGNINGDGFLEPIICGTDTILFLKGTSSFGSLTIAGTYSLSTGDIDGDSDDDILIANNNKVYCLYEPFYIRGTATKDTIITILETQASSTTNIEGRFFFENLLEGTHTLIPTRDFYLFKPSSFTTFLSLSRDDIVFEGSHLYIKGSITENLAGLEGATITLTGEETKTTLSNSSGSYLFELSKTGTYTLKPEKQFYVFSPPQTLIISEDFPSYEQINFQGNYLYIKGSITENGAPLEGATITLTGKETKTTLLDSSGSYIFELSENGTYILEPIKEFYIFSPATKTISILNGGRIENFYGRHMFIKGSVTIDGNPATDSVLSISNIGSTTITDTGSYYFDVSLPGEYTISVEKQGFGFDYEEAIFTINYGNPSIIHNVSGSPLSLCGTITLEESPFASVSVSLSGYREATTTTDSNGYYSFDIFHSGSYTIKPEKEYYGFNPSKKDLFIGFYNPNSIVEFSASLLFLKGSITTEGYSPIDNATITITGDYSTSTTTDLSGSYYILLTYQGTYTITLCKEKYRFRPELITSFISEGKTFDFKGGIPPKIGSITPNIGENTGIISITIEGEEFSTNTTSYLLKGSDKIFGVFSTITASTTIEFVFNIKSSPPGTYSLVLINDGYYPETLTDCFFIGASVKRIEISPSFIYLSDLGEATFIANCFDEWGWHLDRISTWSTTFGIGTLSQDIGTYTVFIAGTLGTTGYIFANSNGAMATSTIFILGASSLNIEGSSTKKAGEDCIFSIKALDKFGAFAPSYNSTIRIFGSNIPMINGLGSFTISFITSGTKTITAYDTNLSSIFGSTTIFIEPASASRVYLYSNPASCDIGTTTILAYITDEFGNPVSDGVIVHWKIMDGTGSLLSTSITKDGTATNILSSRKAEIKRIRATCNYVEEIEIKFIEGETKNLSLSLKEGDEAGEVFVFTCISYDSFGNHTPNFISSATFTSDYSQTAQTYTITGSLTFSLIFDKSGTYTATITAGSIIATTSFFVKPSFLQSLRIGTLSDIVIGSYFDLDIYCYDRFNNLVDPGYIYISDSLQAITYGTTSNFTKYKAKISQMGSDTIRFQASSVKQEISVYVLGTPCLDCKLISSIGTITIKQGSFNQPYRIDVETNIGTISLPSGNIGFGLSITASTQTLASCSIVIEIPYNDKDNDHIVDGTNIDERTLKIYVYEEGWKEIASFVNPSSNILIGTTNHLSVFAPLGNSGASSVLKKVPVFPNPYKAWEKDKHKGKITFGDPSSPVNSEKRLPSPITIRIFNSGGELILKKEDIIPTSGIWEWNVGDVAAGVYFYQLKKGKDEVFGKIGIIK